MGYINIDKNTVIDMFKRSIEAVYELDLGRLYSNNKDIKDWSLFTSIYENDIYDDRTVNIAYLFLNQITTGLITDDLGNYMISEANYKDFIRSNGHSPIEFYAQILNAMMDEVDDIDLPDIDL